MTTTLEKIKKANEIKINLESQNGYFVKNNIVRPFNLTELDTETVKYIIENGEQVSREYDIISTYGDVYKYSIDNGGEYEFHSNVFVYSFKYFSNEEFEKMCIEAQKEIKKEHGDGYEIKDIYTIASMLETLYPDTFIKVSLAQVFCP